MLLPQFTIRTLLMVLTMCAVVSVFAGIALRGQNWAWGVTIGLLSLVFTAVVHAAWFGIVWIFGRMRPEARNNEPSTM